MAADHSLYDGKVNFQRCGVHRSARQVCLLVLLAVAVGCSSSSVVPVTGTVKQANGEPLAGGRVLFQPSGEATQPARARVSSDGSFRLGTFEADDGAVPGVHKVVVVPLVPPEAGDDPKLIAQFLAAVNRRYQNLRTTPLEFTVSDDGSTNHFDIVLEPPDPE